MPYIKDRRKQLSPCKHHVASAKNAGELNYQITRLCHRYLTDNGVEYKNINDVLGALEGAKLEFYRRVVAPYEDIKIRENGDL